MDRLSTGSRHRASGRRGVAAWRVSTGANMCTVWAGGPQRVNRRVRRVSRLPLQQPGKADRGTEGYSLRGSSFNRAA